MRRVLRKRIPRELKEHFLRYLALILLTTMGMYIVVSLVDAAETIIYRTEQNQTDNHLEDGQVTLFKPFLDSEIEEIEDAGVTIEEHISFEATLDNGDVLRIFRNREKIDLVVVDEGKIASNDSEIVIEKRYAECNDIHTGDEIEIAGRHFTVSGIGTSVDYDAPFRKLSDTAIKSDSFGTAFVTTDAYDYIKRNGPEITEDITYAFILNDAMTKDELKDTIRDFEFDYEIQDNITAFVMAKDNVRVGGAAGDVVISKQAGLVAGVIVMILFTYVLSVFVVHQIQNESSVIGALYALGVKKGDLTGHYVLLPTLVSF